MNGSPPVLRHTPSDEGLISRYEALRQQALEQPHAAPRGQGLALLIRSGVRVWMQAWAQHVVKVAAPSKERLGDSEIFPFEMHREVTMILAGMVLCGHREAIV